MKKSTVQNIVITVDPVSGNVVSCQVNLFFTDTTDATLGGAVTNAFDVNDSAIQSFTIEANKLLAVIRAQNGVS